ncbi:hypothetical protein ES705_11137 [subsurface metagenome]
MTNEKEKFIIYEKIRRKGLYNMLDYKKVLPYAKRYFKLDITKEEYIELVENYSELKARYSR